MSLVVACLALSAACAPATVAHVEAEARRQGVSPTVAVAVCVIESGCRGANPLGVVSRPRTVARGVAILARVQRLGWRRGLCVYQGGPRCGAAGREYARRVLRVVRMIERLRAREV